MIEPSPGPIFQKNRVILPIQSIAVRSLKLKNFVILSTTRKDRATIPHELSSPRGPMENSAERPPVKDWAVLVYIAADVSQRGMHWAARRNVQQMVDTGSNEQVWVAAQYDSPGEPTRRYVFPQRPPGAETWEVKPVDSLKNVDSADPRTIEKFFEWGINACPAKNTMLVLWGHGFGLDDYTPKGVGRVPRRVSTASAKAVGPVARAGPQAASLGSTRLEGAAIVDEHSHEVMTDRQIGDALRECEAMARSAGGNLAIMGFDSCVMAMAEVWCELANGPQIGIGSQAGLPYTSWPYDLFLARLLARPKSDSRTVAGMLVDSFADFYRNGNQYVTLSACDLLQLDNLKRAMAPLAQALTAVAGDSDARKAIFSARDASPCYDPDGFIDLDCFCGFLQQDLPDDTVFYASRRVREELRKFILASAYGPQDPTRMVSLSGGVSIWFPPWIEDPSIREDEKAQSEAYLRSGYGQTQFGISTRWGEFLHAMLRPGGGSAS